MKKKPNKVVALFWDISGHIDDIKDGDIDDCLSEYLSQGWKLKHVNMSETKLIHHLEK